MAGGSHEMYWQHESRIKLHLHNLTNSVFSQQTKNRDNKNWTDVRIHCADQKIVHANRQFLSLGSLLFRTLLDNECACIGVVQDVLCPDFGSVVLGKVLDSLQFGNVLIDGLSKSEVDEIKSIVDTLQIFALTISSLEPQVVIEVKRESDISARNQPQDFPIIVESSQISIQIEKRSPHVSSSSSSSSSEEDDENFPRFNETENIQESLLSFEQVLKEENETNANGHSNQMSSDEQSVHEDLDTSSDSDEQSVHEDLDTSSDEEPPEMKCGICSKTFLNRFSLNRHLADVHGDTKESESGLKCNVCEGTFKNTKSLQQHKRSVHKIRLPYQCTICNKVFNQFIDYRRHKSKIHGKNSSGKCTVCEKSFSNLKRHMQNVHTQKKLQECEICHQTFTRKPNMLRHMAKAHKNFVKCSRCEKTFSDGAKLKRHIAQVHANDEPILIEIN